MHSGQGSFEDNPGAIPDLDPLRVSPVMYSASLRNRYLYRELLTFMFQKSHSQHFDSVQW